MFQNVGKWHISRDGNRSRDVIDWTSLDEGSRDRSIFTGVIVSICLHKDDSRVDQGTTHGVVSRIDPRPYQGMIKMTVSRVDLLMVNPGVVSRVDQGTTHGVNPGVVSKIDPRPYQGMIKMTDSGVDPLLVNPGAVSRVDQGTTPGVNPTPQRT